MKKTALAALCLILSLCALALTACDSTSDRINEDSEILSVSVTAADGFTFELDDAQTEFVTSVLLRTSEFESDPKTSIIGWEFAYDYKIRFTVPKRKFLFKRKSKPSPTPSAPPSPAPTPLANRSAATTRRSGPASPLSPVRGASPTPAARTRRLCTNFSKASSCPNANGNTTTSGRSSSTKGSR